MKMKRRKKVKLKRRGEEGRVTRKRNALPKRIATKLSKMKGKETLV